MSLKSEDHVRIIGGNLESASKQDQKTKRWGHYYHRTYTSVVRHMLAGCGRGAVLDVGTSTGVWYPFLLEEGFSEIFGAEIEPDRAAIAEAKGYRKVYVGDAAAIDRPETSLDVVISNDVFVHMLDLEEKVAVLRKVESLLKPGGSFIFNHPIGKAFAMDGLYSVKGHCSFLSLGAFIDLVRNNTSFEIVDIKPTYYHWRNITPPSFIKILRSRITWPGVAWLLWLADRMVSDHLLPLEESDTVYLHLMRR